MNRSINMLLTNKWRQYADNYPVYTPMTKSGRQMTHYAYSLRAMENKWQTKMDGIRRIPSI